MKSFFIEAYHSIQYITLYYVHTVYFLLVLLGKAHMFHTSFYPQYNKIKIPSFRQAKLRLQSSFHLTYSMTTDENNEI